MLAFVIISILHVVIGEIVPKSYTLPRAEQVALAVAPLIGVFFFVFAWFIAFLDWLAQLVMRMLGIPPTDELEGSHSEVELRMLLRQGERAGVLEAEEQQMIDKVFDFSDTPVEDVMVPRPDIVALPVALTPTAAMEQVLQHPYTRYPVYGEDFDDVLGVLHVRRLFVALQNGAAASTDLRALLYPAHLVPETKRLGQLLTEIRRQKGHMAIVVDEYGSVAGLVTLEDLLEEIVGEIDDEFDPEDAPIVRLGPDRYRVEGSLPVEEFNERFERDLSDEDYHTVGGIVFGELGRAPAVGDSVEIGTSSSTSRRSTARASCTPTRRCSRYPRRTRRQGRRRLVSYRPARGGAGSDLMQAAPLTVALIAINIVVYVLQARASTSSCMMDSGTTGGSQAVQGSVDGHYGLWGPMVSSGEWWRLLTSGFLHANLIHIGSNMLALFFIGRALEPALGWLRLGVIYFVSLAAGSLGVMLLEPGTLSSAPRARSSASWARS